MTRPTHRRIKPWIGWKFLLGASLAAGASAQITTQPVTVAPGAVEVLAAATEGHLWMIEVAPTRSRLLHRGVAGVWDRGRVINGRVRSLHAADDQVLLVFDDNSILSYGATESRPVLVLPDREPPLDLAGSQGVVFGLVAATTASQMPRWSETSKPTSALAPGEAEVAVVRLEGRPWSGLTPCPRGVTRNRIPRLAPRLLPTEAGLLLGWSAQPDQLAFSRFDPSTSAWQPLGTLDVRDLTGFWLTQVSRVLTLVVAQADPAGERLTAFRWLGGSSTSAAAGWQASELSLAATPNPVRVLTWHAALGFNQHLALLARDSEHKHLVLFGVFGGQPTEAAFRPADVFSRADSAVPGGEPLQLLMLLILVGVFVGLFVFRRSSISTPVALPGGFELAFAFQRLSGFLIDFVPFSLAAAGALQVSWTEAVRAIGYWAISSDFADSGMPAREALLWWGLSAGGFFVYVTIMELVAGRTIGKVLSRTVVLTDAGTRPQLWQVLTRNASRLVELLPPMWVLSFVVIITRNRQRVGDIFARTVVVRRVQAQSGRRSVPGTDDHSADDHSGNRNG